MRRFDFRKNRALIFTSLSVAGVFGVAGIGVWAGMRIERARIAHKGEKLTIKDYAKLFWKEYVALSLAVIATSGFAIASHRVSAKDIARLATLATGSGAAFRKYRDKIKEVVGEEKEKELFEQVKAKEDWACWPSIASPNDPAYDVMDTKFRLDLGVDELEPVEFYSNYMRVSNALWCFQRDNIIGRIVDVALLKDFLGIPYETIDHKYFWIDTMFYEAGYESPWIEFKVIPIKDEFDKNGKQVFAIITDDSPITDEELKKIEDGSYWEEWRYKVEKED